MHHSREKVRGFLYKRGERVTIFNYNLYQKRYLVISSHHGALYIQDNVVSQKVTKIPKSELLYIDKVIDYSPLALASLSPRSRKEIDSVTCKYKYSYTLNTVKRKYTLFARTKEE